MHTQYHTKKTIPIEIEFESETEIENNIESVVIVYF